MYDHNLADNQQPLPFDVNIKNAAPAPPLQPNHQQPLEGLSHDDQHGAGCPTGRWVYGMGRRRSPSSHLPRLCMPYAWQTAAIFLVIRAATILVLFLLPNKYSTDNKPTVRVHCKSLVKYSLTICDGKVTLAPTNTSDPHQHWIKEEKFGINVKDEDGRSSFALVNKATGQALKHSIGQTYPVQLIKYDPHKLDESVLWTRGVTQEDGYSAIRAVYNICLNLDAYDCTKDLERAEIFQLSWNRGKNQLWSLAFFCK